jgi:hypothetical protein
LFFHAPAAKAQALAEMNARRCIFPFSLQEAVSYGKNNLPTGS